MDNLSEDDLQDIWNRTKSLIDTSKIKSTSRDGIVAELSAAVRSAAEKNPSLKGLVRGNFASNAVNIVKDALGLTKGIGGPPIKLPSIAVSIKRKLKDLFSLKEIKQIVLQKEPLRASVGLVAQKVEGVKFNEKTNRVNIQTSKGKRSFALKNVRATIGMNRGNPTAYFFNLRTSKMISRKKILK